MRKPYIGIQHYVIDFAGVLLALVSLIYSIVKKGLSEEAMAVPISMIVLTLAVTAVFFLIPARLWNLPVKPKAGRENLIFSDMALIGAIFSLESGIFSFATSLLNVASGKTMAISSTIYVVSLFVALIVMVCIAIKHNK
ncbi:MAG: hypothetical protein MJ123_03555 [Lachnospiraceae bacterium]|nr:hypothetical protein [Lachnospiraceae bacterium]